MSTTEETQQQQEEQQQQLVEERKEEEEQNFETSEEKTKESSPPSKSSSNSKKNGVVHNSNGSTTRTPNCRIFLGNLASEKTSARELYEIFSKYGNIVEDIVMRRSFGFIQFDTPEAAHAAIKGENGRVIGGMRLDINLADNREPRGKQKERRQRGVQDKRTKRRKRRSRSPPRKEPPVICEVVYIALAQRHYATSLQGLIEAQLGFTTVTYFIDRLSIDDVIFRATRRGVKYLLVVTRQHQTEGTVDIHTLLHRRPDGRPIVIAHISLQEAIDMIASEENGGGYYPPPLSGPSKSMPLRHIEPPPPFSRIETPPPPFYEPQRPEIISPMSRVGGSFPPSTSIVQPRGVDHHFIPSSSRQKERPLLGLSSSSHQYPPSTLREERGLPNYHHPGGTVIAHSFQPQSTSFHHHEREIGDYRTSAPQFPPTVPSQSGRGEPTAAISHELLNNIQNILNSLQKNNSSGITTTSRGPPPSLGVDHKHSHHHSGLEGVHRREIPTPSHNYYHAAPPMIPPPTLNRPYESRTDILPTTSVMHSPPPPSSFPPPSGGGGGSSSNGSSSSGGPYHHHSGILPYGQNGPPPPTFSSAPAQRRGYTDPSHSGSIPVPIDQQDSSAPYIQSPVSSPITTMRNSVVLPSSGGGGSSSITSTSSPPGAGVVPSSPSSSSSILLQSRGGLSSASLHADILDLLHKTSGRGQ